MLYLLLTSNRTDTYLQEASTLGSVYLVSVYGLFDIGNMRKGHVSCMLAARVTFPLIYFSVF